MRGCVLGGLGIEGVLGPITGRNIRIICNLDMGGTNPQVIEILINGGAVIRQHERLHAKIYIGKYEAILTSANASS
jgi:hypothetical protein